MKNKGIMLKPRWLEYAIFYPSKDEEGYDGVHDGGIKGVRDDTPDDIKKEFEEYLRETRNGLKI